MSKEWITQDGAQRGLKTTNLILCNVQTQRIQLSAISLQIKDNK